MGFLTPMLESITQRRYLISFNAARLPQQFTDVLVIGGGVAGLRAAIAAADAGAEVLLLTKDTIGESNTWYAQGGIAAVLQPLDSYESHIHDTEIGGALRGACAPLIGRPKRKVEGVLGHADTSGVWRRCASLAARYARSSARSIRASVSSRPSSATDSKMPGDTVDPLIATRIGW